MVEQALMIGAADDLLRATHTLKAATGQAIEPRTIGDTAPLRGG
jgi:hypothetical protein